MTTISSAVPIGSQTRVQAEFKSGLDDFTKDLMVRQKERLAAELAYNPQEQLAAQNAAEVSTAFRLNGKLVGTISEQGFTRTGINDNGAFDRAQAQADARGLTGEKRTTFVGEQVSAELQARYGSSLEVINYPEGQRPTSGEMHSEMFGGSSSQYEGMSSDRMAYIKHFAQSYDQTFGENPFAGLDVPYDDQ